MKSGKSTNIMDTRVMVKAAFLTAISIVLTRFLAVFVPLAGGLPAIRLSFGEVPIMMGGLLFGTVVGGITGLAADLVGVLINPQGAFHPGFTLSSILWGAIPGLLSILYKRNKSYDKIYSLRNIAITVFISYVLISLGLNTLWLSSMFGKGFMILLPCRIISAIVNIPLQSIIIVTLMKYLKGLINS